MDLNCLQESTQFPEEMPPSAPSSQAPDYGATDLQMHDPQFHHQTMGEAAPLVASNKGGGSSKGATGGKLAPVNLSLTGRKTSSKSSSWKSSSKTCPYCTISPGENLHRHAYRVHVPWYMDPTQVCWTCLQFFKQPSMLEVHQAQCTEGNFQWQAATWTPQITTFFCTVAQELSLPSMEDLVPFITQNYWILPQSYALDPQDQEVMKLFELNYGTYPSQHRIYQPNPPNYLAALIQWWIISGLLSPQACIDLMETPVGVQVTSQEDAPPQPSQLPTHPLPLPHTGPPPSTSAVPPTIKKMLKVTSYPSASATLAHPSTETSASLAPLMSLRVSCLPNQPSQLAASSSGATAHLSTTAPSSKTCIVESTLGTTLKVSVLNTSQEDPPPLEDVAPHVALTPYLTADGHCHLQQLVGNGETRYASLEAALAVSVPHAICINPMVPSYCQPNTWEDILQPHPWEARYITLGWHPTQAAQCSDALLEQFHTLLVTPNIMALGKVGLDYNWISHTEKPHQDKACQPQQELLEIMCREAKSHYLPLVLHCQDVGWAESATNDCLDILQCIFYNQQEQLEWPIYLHCFNYGMDVALHWTSIFAQVYFSISPLLLNAQCCHEELPHVICNIPWEKILLETDSPYLPAPEAEDAIPSLVHVYHVAERVKALRNEVSVQAVLGAGDEAMMWFYHI